MIDPRTAEFLEEFLKDPARNPTQLDRFLLFGPNHGGTSARTRLTVSFHDFWPEFDPRASLFMTLLSARFAVTVVEDDADLAIVSVFGNRHESIKARKTLWFTGENRRPPLDRFDMCVSFDRLDHPRHFRLPLYVAHAWDHRREGATRHFCQPVLPPNPPTRDEFDARKFCAFLYKNPNGTRRNAFFEKLHMKRPVDGLGWHLNNTGIVVKMGWLPKIKVFQRYRFAFAFENEGHPGYLTEKILDAFQAGAVPLYWGDPDMKRDVAAGSFIDVDGFGDDDAAVAHILSVDDDYDAYAAYRSVAPFLGTEDFHFDAFRLTEWIGEIL